MAWLRVECAVTEAEFWDSTPAKVSALVSARKDQMRREDYRSGIVTATIRAALGGKNIDCFDDFPEWKQAKPKKTSNLAGYLNSFVDKSRRKNTKP